MEQRPAHIPIALTAQGVLDFASVEKLTVDQLEAWIQARLSGDDPYYPLNPERGESPLLVFLSIAMNTESDELIAKMNRAIRRIIKRLTSRPWAELDASERSLFVSILILVEQVNTEDNRLRSYIDETLPEILFGMARSGAYRQANHDGASIQNRLLFALCACQSRSHWLATRNFWQEHFKNYPAPAFDAFVRWAPRDAIAMLPDLVARTQNRPEAAEIEIDLLSEKLIGKSDFDWASEVEAVFHGVDQEVRAAYDAMARELELPLPEELVSAPDEDPPESGDDTEPENNTEPERCALFRLRESITHQDKDEPTQDDVNKYADKDQLAMAC